MSILTIFQYFFASKVLFYILANISMSKDSNLYNFLYLLEYHYIYSFFADRIKQFEELLKGDQNENWWNKNMDIKQLCEFFNK